MPTPHQPIQTLDTPFGPVELRDGRHFEDRDDDALAYFYFPEKVEVNRKEYERLRFSLKRGYSSENPFYIYQDSGSYRDLTDSARGKLTKALEEHKDKFGPYMEELDPDTIRAQRKRKIRGQIFGEGLSKPSPSDYHKGPAYDQTTELIDEIMTEIMTERASGKTWSEIYYDKD